MFNAMWKRYLPYEKYLVLVSGISLVICNTSVKYFWHVLIGWLWTRIASIIHLWEAGETKLHINNLISDHFLIYQKKYTYFCYMCCTGIILINDIYSPRCWWIWGIFTLSLHVPSLGRYPPLFPYNSVNSY